MINNKPLLGASANSKPLCQQSPLPNVSDALAGWTMTIFLVKITQSIVNDGIVAEKADQIPFQAVVQPLSARQIALKPEGERAWTWLQIHMPVNSQLKLNTNDRIMYNCCKYKIMARIDQSNSGFIEYHAVQDFQ